MTSIPDARAKVSRVLLAWFSGYGGKHGRGQAHLSQTPYGPAVCGKTQLSHRYRLPETFRPFDGFSYVTLCAKCKRIATRIEENTR